MARRYLFGPVTPPFAEQCLNLVRKEGACLAFDADGKTDLAIGAADSWGQVCGRFPAGWQPDFIALWLPYTSTACLWSAPVPVVGLALDWPLLWHYYRRRLRSCDLTFIDPPGAEALAAEGISHVRPANLYGCDRAFLDLLPNDGAVNNLEVAGPRQADAATARDIDVLCVGNMNPAVQRQRLPWLMRLARLGKRWRVAIHAGVFGDSYRKLLSRARIVFNQVAQPRCSRRVFEAAAAGALLFEDAANPATAAYFGDRQECVYYNADNLEALLEHYLAHESERQALAEAGRKRACDFTFEAYWEGIVNEIEEEWPALLRRARRRRLPGKREDLLLRSWQALSAPLRADPALTRDLEKALAAEPESHALRHALGLTLSRAQADASAAAALAAVAAGHFQQAVAGRPENLIARLNLVEALHAAGQKEAAIEQARQTLAALSLLPEIDLEQLEGGYFPADYGLFRVEWEKAAWSNAGQPVAEIQAKLTLLRWQLHILLARLTGDVVHSYEALLARPDLSYSAAALGCTLAREHPLEALAPLAQALAGNPFEREAARALHHVLGVLGDQQSRRLLVEERRLLARAAPHVAPAESWFSEPPPSPQDLASIIILCCNQMDYTRLCLESVLAHTRPPYELIVVDNGSTDGTPAYLAELRSRPGPARVDVVRNEVNQGFPAGCNQGLARARGRYFVFLNNDTVVTPGWLAGLVGGSLRDWPSVGLVGAVTNHAPDAQGVRGDYKGLDCLAQFAGRRRREFAGQVLDVRRLTGFCLLVRREVFERIGKFDERFGVGFFDDDDLCLRSREAGFRLLVALDVYIHHFGSRTFKGLGINSREQLSKNFDMFRAKWGAEQVAGYRLMGAWPEPKRDDEIAPDVVAEPAGAMAQPSEGVLELVAGHVPSEDAFVQAEEISGEDASVVARSPDRATGPTEEAACTPEVIAGNLAQVLVGLTPEPRRPKNALTMIVKNEETRLPACLESAGDLFDEVIVVDTGSTDNTKEVALRYGARVYDFPWVDSFAAARNEALRHATARWIMWLDADDRLDHQNRERVRLLFDGLGGEMAAYAVKVRSVLDAANLSFRLLDQVRIFPNHPEVRWDYRVHEQTLPGVLRLGGQIRWSDIVVDHVGYQQVEVRRSKLERNLRLLEMDDAERPDDAFTLFNLGWTMMDLGQTEQALPRLKRSLERSSPDSSIARKLYHLIAIAHRHFGRKDEALKVCRDGLERYPDDSELLFEEASLLLDAKDVEHAEINLLRLVETRPGPYFGSVDDGMRGYKTRDLFGLPAQRRLARAALQIDRIRHWEKECSGLSAAELRLAGLRLRGRARGGEALDKLLPEAFGLVCVAAVRTLGLRPFDVQLAGGVVLHHGAVAELATGEGKTLVAALPAFLNALPGKGVHIATVNDYLAARDRAWMRPIYEALGLKAGVLQMQMPDNERQCAYRCDITYGTASEFGFDFLRDRLKTCGGKGEAAQFWEAWASGNSGGRLPAAIQRRHYYAIVDEADSIFIDEARTPLIIAAPTRPATPEESVAHRWADRVVRAMQPEVHFTLNRRTQKLELTRQGQHLIRYSNPPVGEHADALDKLHERVEQAVHAHHRLRRDQHYLVHEGKVLIIDEYTGRRMPDRHWREGLHQAAEAKEGVPVTLRKLP